MKLSRTRLIFGVLFLGRSQHGRKGRSMVWLRVRFQKLLRVHAD